MYNKYICIIKHNNKLNNHIMATCLRKKKDVRYIIKQDNKDQSLVSKAGGAAPWS